ncbi:MAG: nucleoside hydrolase, partial [Acidobacteriota bacterium]|nr:nucleoside hydrolase [Acidobacteriota bacterium]
MRRLLLVSSLMLPILTAAVPRNIIIDTDAGTDDLMAIAFLLSRPDVRIEAITVVNGLAHVPAGARNIERLLQLAGKPEIPVYEGRPTPLEGANEFPAPWRLVADELPGVGLPTNTRNPEPASAVSY